MSETKEIMVCNNCDMPLIWTFAWSGAEYYCMSCGALGGMLGAGHRVELTDDLKAANKKIKARWGQVKKWAGDARFYLRDCDKCDMSSENREYHGQHLTEFEREKRKWATKKLNEWCFSNETS